MKPPKDPFSVKTPVLRSFAEAIGQAASGNPVGIARAALTGIRTLSSAKRREIEDWWDEFRKPPEEGGPDQRRAEEWLRDTLRDPRAAQVIFDSVIGVAREVDPSAARPMARLARLYWNRNPDRLYRNTLHLLVDADRVGLDELRSVVRWLLANFEREELVLDSKRTQLKVAKDESATGSKPRDRDEEPPLVYSEPFQSAVTRLRQYGFGVPCFSNRFQGPAPTYTLVYRSEIEMLSTVLGPPN